MPAVLDRRRDGAASNAGSSEPEEQPQPLPPRHWPLFWPTVVCRYWLRGRSDRDLPSCWLRRLAAVVSGKHLAWAVPLRTMVILSLIEAIFEIQSW